MIKVKFPSQNEIAETRKRICKRLEDKAINRFANAGIKEGYNDCLRIIDERSADPSNSYFKPETDAEIEQVNEIYRSQLTGINKLKSQQGRAIAIMCVDYLNGQLAADNLCNLPIPKR